jgi:rod shape-determining protein MreD
MRAAQDRHWLAPFLSVVVALLLSIVPLPESVVAFRPGWVALVMLYWCLVEPRRYMLVSALVAGLVLDSLVGSLLGQHALALLVVVYLSQRFYIRIRTLPAPQVLVIGIVLLGVYEFILYWLDGITGEETSLVDLWRPVAVGGVLLAFVLTNIERSRQEAAARM